MKLYLCEKPPQAKDIARVLGATRKAEGCLQGDGITVTWCFGHLLEMAPPEKYGEQYKRWSLEPLPILPAQWRLEVRAGARKQFQIIKTLLAGSEEVVIATDADREGETIAREVLQQCRWCGPVSRLWLSALDEASIRKALAELRPGAQTEALYAAGLGRARADWLVGMNLTRAYTVLGRERGQEGVRSVGRVQTPTLRLVVDRDRAIEAFRPTPYWELWVTFVNDKGETFRARWLAPEAVADAEGRCTNEPAARRLAQALLGGQGIVTALETKRVQEPPPLPYDLGTLQQEADKRFGMGAQQVLDTVQSLYETHKAVTYPRTDCPYLPQSMLAEAPAVLDALARTDPDITCAVSGADLTLCSRAWNDGRITAHHAIIPTSAPTDLSRMRDDERRLYDLIRRRYLAQFYPAHEFDRTLATLSVGAEQFRAAGRQPVVEGWKALYPQVRDDTDPDAQALPALVQGARCPVSGTDVLAKQTRPPARFTEGTLIAAMKQVAKLITDPRLKQVLRETAGLGTEATRAGIIKTLLERGFLVKRGRQLTSTDAGRAHIDILPEPVKDPGTTALWEQRLEDIASGRGALEAFVQEQAQWVAALVTQAKQDRGTDAAPASPHPCPECGQPLRRRTGRNGAFWGCSGYPECRTTLPDKGGRPDPRQRKPLGTCQCGGDILASPKAWQCKTCNSIVWRETFGKRLTEKQALALLRGEPVQLKGLKRKTGGTFDAGARLEDAKLRLVFDEAPAAPRTGRSRSTEAVPGQRQAGACCPDCGKGSLVQRTVREGKNAGRSFLGCTRFPACRYFAWHGPASGRVPRGTPGNHGRRRAGG